MSDWQKGDLALCFTTKPLRRTLANNSLCRLSVGCIYHVIDARESEIWLDEVRSSSVSGGWFNARFRKVTPPKDMKLEPLEIEVQA